MVRQHLSSLLKAVITTFLCVSSAFSCGSTALTEDTCRNQLADLELCSKSLNDYLETKRVAFPRFYFLAPADLLDILSKVRAGADCWPNSPHASHVTVHIADMDCGLVLADLLDILSKGSSPWLVQKHFSKNFDSINGEATLVLSFHEQ
eukprot:SAG22_NODE_38_length_26325_cov_107.302067_18_plen_149_part_00